MADETELYTYMLRCCRTGDDCGTYVAASEAEAIATWRAGYVDPPPCEAVTCACKGPAPAGAQPSTPRDPPRPRYAPRTQPSRAERRLFRRMSPGLVANLADRDALEYVRPRDSAWRPKGWR